MLLNKVTSFLGTLEIGDLLDYLDFVDERLMDLDKTKGIYSFFEMADTFLKTVFFTEFKSLFVKILSS